MKLTQSLARGKQISFSGMLPMRTDWKLKKSSEMKPSSGFHIVFKIDNGYFLSLN
jgi:hypothetical protein